MKSLIRKQMTSVEVIKEWQKVKAYLKGLMGESLYLLWGAPLDLLKIVENRIIIGCPDKFFVSEFSNNYLIQLEQSISETKLNVYAIEFFVTPETKSHSVKPLQEIKDDIVLKTREPYQLYLFPTDLCRTTFCRPISRKCLRPASESFDHPPHNTKWATIIFHGPDCGMLEEDALICIIKRWVKEDCKGFSCDYSDLLDDLEYKRSKQNKHYPSSYEKLHEIIDRLSKTTFKLIINKGNNKTSGMKVNVLSRFKWDDELNKAYFDLDDWFVKTIAAGLVSGIEHRHLIKGDIAKALQRFISSHGHDGHNPLLDVAQAIHYDLQQPLTVIRRRLKDAVTELKRIGYLTKKSQVRNDIVHWYRAGATLSGPKLVDEIRKKTGS